MSAVLVVFLASARAANGSSVVVDGGMVTTLP
jgi:hypothetical protein